MIKLTAKKMSVGVKKRAVSLTAKKRAGVKRGVNPIKKPVHKYVVYFETGSRGARKAGYICGDGKYDTDIQKAKPFFSEVGAYKAALEFALSYSNIIGIVEVKKF